MTLLAAGVFVLSLSGIVVLFALKYLEERHGRAYAPKIRQYADLHATRTKTWLLSHSTYIETFPARFFSLLAHMIHLLAVRFAKLAHEAADGAHALADMVSHKRNFEKRETRSEFLKQVDEFKNGNGHSRGGGL